MAPFLVLLVGAANAGDVCSGIKFKDDPLFEAIVQKGREYRESQPYPEDVEQ